MFACGNGYYGQLGLDQEIDFVALGVRSAAQFSPVVVKALLPFTIAQIACGETFSLFVSNKSQLFVTGLLELPEAEFDKHRDTLAVPHQVPFDGEILKVAAGTRFALVTEAWKDEA